MEGHNRGQVGTVGQHFVSSQQSMIKSMIKLVGDHLWQRGTNCGSLSCPGGGESCSAANSLGDQAWLLQLVRGGINFGGTGCSMTGLYWT